MCQFLRRASGQAGGLLLVGGLLRQRTRLHGFARQFRVCAQQGQARVQRCMGHGLGQGELQLRQTHKRPLCQRRIRHPRGMLVHAVEQARCGVQWQGVQRFQRQRHGFFLRRVVQTGAGWVAAQCRAMSTRRATQTLS